ncbi:MAG: hypothetical protein ABW133_19300, partial [Polyangiaceae bacterium]
MTHFGSSLRWIALLMPAVLGACAQESYPQAEWRTRNRGWENTPLPEGSAAADASVDVSAPSVDAASDVRTPDAGAVDVSVPETSRPAPACASPVSASEALVARLAVTSSSVPKATRPVFVSDLFSLFESNCGGCHVAGSSGGFHVTSLDFAEKVDKNSIDRIRSDQRLLTMPPISAGGKMATERMQGDPVLELASLLQLWIDAKRPRDVFDIPNVTGGTNSYILEAAAGDNLTNLGDCIPAKRIVATDQTTVEKLDTFFDGLKRVPAGTGTLAQRIGLPERLDQTDLSTFDTETLARRGVIAFVPAYPLWSDGSGKLRHVRVPKGKSIRFDEATQSFDIPANTRFYKTFLKRIVDVDGVISYRKIETRLIVARPDIQKADGSNEVTALYGSYAWNEEETEATLVTDPLRNGEPFRDRMLTYITDEPLAQSIRNQKPNNLTFALERVNAIRRYAIPGSDRCVQCHMGSPTKDFVLGFLPVQIHRRPMGQSGVIEPTGADELSQMQRLIDYGIVTGMTSPSQVLPLEKQEGTRKPRTEQELIAQGYMLGNCAHCHNPRGFPSVTAPVLSDLLNFLPGPNGGVFEFPLDRTSPRIFRGLNSDEPIPYITPSLMDVTPTSSSTPKWDFIEFAPGSKDLTFKHVLVAPWRSLIFRNVDTPFTYADDNALFPHMPMNVAGFDCRAPHIMGDWMVSLPARWKSRKTYDFAVGLPANVEGASSKYAPPGYTADFSPQPYEEVKPDDPEYEGAVADGKHRIDLFHSGRTDNNAAAKTYNRYEICPDTSDIVDREVLRDPVQRPVPKDEQLLDTKTTPPTVALPTDGVPNRAHWVVTDLTEVGGEWNPRRADWKTILVDQAFPPLKPEDYPPSDFEAVKLKRQREIDVVKILQSTTLNGGGFDAFAMAPLPFGLWRENSSCNLAKERTVGSYSGDSMPAWMKGAPSDAHVYPQLPGEAVYNMICVNCHGVNYDSLGRQADNLVLMTGGSARVANFKVGLFGPADQPGGNRSRVFGPFVTPGANPDDMGGRYMSWMALGGTAQIIPSALLAIVANTDVLGVRRSWSKPPSSANMLDTAKSLCASVLGIAEGTVLFPPGEFGKRPSPARTLGLIRDNGDFELWRT